MSFTSAPSRWSDVYLVAAARGISMCGDFLAATALALALQASGAGGLAVSGLWLASTLPLVALAPLTGRLADRVDSRVLLVAAGLVQAATCAALAFAAGPVLIIALVAVLACGLAVTQPVLAALVPEMVRPDDLPRASALTQTAGLLGVLVGPALAGVLVGSYGVRLPLLLDAASFLAIVAAGLLLRTRRGGSARTAPAAADGPAPAGGWRLRRDPLLLTMVAAVAASIGAVAAINVLEVFFVRETLGASTTMYGLIGAAWTAGMLAGAWLIARIAGRVAADGALVHGMLAMLGGTALVILLASTVPAALWLVPLFALGGVLNGGENVVSTVLVARRVPAGSRGQAFATMSAATQGALMIGYLGAGVLLERFTPRPLVAAAGLTGLVVVLLAVAPVLRATRRERAAFATVPAVN